MKTKTDNNASSTPSGMTRLQMATHMYTTLFLGLLIGITILADDTHGQNGTYDVRDFGAAGDGQTDDSEAFHQLLQEIPEDGARIEILAGEYVVDDITFPDRITIAFQSGGKLHIPDEGKVEINGSIDAGLIHIFSGDGKVTGSIDNLQVFPEWFGAQGDGTHDDAPAMQKAADLAVESQGNTLFIPNGEYLFKQDLEFRSNIENRGTLVKEMEIDEERTDLYPHFIERHYPKNNPIITFAPDHEELELNMDTFYGVEEGAVELPTYRDVPLADGSGTIDLAAGGNIRFGSTDFFISRNNQKGDQYYDPRDISQIVSGRGDIYPELVFSYHEPIDVEEWSPDEFYEKGDYVTYDGVVFKATWRSGEGSLFEDDLLGRVEIGPVRPDPDKLVTGYDFTYNGNEDAMNIWRRVETQVWYQPKDRPVTVNGLIVELRLKGHGGEVKRLAAGAVSVNRSNMTFNNLEISVRDPEATVSRLLSTRNATNLEFNNGYFSGATFHGLGYNISNRNVANLRYNNCISTNSRKGLDGSYAKNITITGGYYNKIDKHYGHNIKIRDVVMSGLSTTVPGYGTPDVNLQEWGFTPRSPFGFAGGNIHIEDVTITEASSGIFYIRTDTPNLYGNIVLRNINIKKNDGDVLVYRHQIDPDFDFYSELRVPNRLIIEDIQLNDPGQLNLTLGRGFDEESYGSVEVRNSGPVGEVYTSASPLLFSGCTIDNGEFMTEPMAVVNFRNCTFLGNTTGLEKENIGVATGNVKSREASVNFPLNMETGKVFEK